MEFRYRYVGYGQRFVPRDGLRSTGDEEPATLYANELALDVGSACYGYAGEQRAIVDHHFHRPEGQFPSAAAAVLHKAEWIWQRFGNGRPSERAQWLVTHREPDFDAYCAMYLARGVIDGRIPHDGWTSFGMDADGWSRRRGAIDWFAPRMRWETTEPTRACAILLASLAASIDNCRRLHVPRERALNAVLYAGRLRGRALEESGAVALFDEACRLMTAQRLNPLVDSVLERSDEFRSELALLDRQVAAYDRDMTRARRLVVSVQRTDQPFAEWYGPVQARPLLDGNLRLNPEQRLAGHPRVQTDGVFLRDPECLFFKEWARTDTEHAPASRGFRFTGIAYSDGAPDAAVNGSRYVFALDPERAAGAHLYGVWARLQAEEVRALNAEARAPKGVPASGGPARSGYEQRAAGLLSFDDPWFDGANYACTIVDTPNRGAAFGPPGSDDTLADDRVCHIVLDELEFACFSGPAEIQDLPATAEAVVSATPAWREVRLAEPLPLQAAHFRIGRVGLDANLDLDHAGLSAQIGRRLWGLLEGDSEAGVPADFLERHLVRHEGWVGVWSRRGAIVASTPEARAAASSIVDLFVEMAALMVDLSALVARAYESEDAARDTVHAAEAQIRRAAQLKHRLVLSENRLAARFFEAARIEPLLDTIRVVSAAATARLEGARARAIADGMAKNVRVVAHVQTMVEWIEVFLISVYAAHLWHMFAAENEPLHHVVEEHTPPWLVGWVIPVSVLLAAAIGALLGLRLIKPWRQKVAGEGTLQSR